MYYVDVFLHSSIHDIDISQLWTGSMRSKLLSDDYVIEVTNEIICEAELCLTGLRGKIQKQ